MRLLVTPGAACDAAWADWQALRQASPAMRWLGLARTRLAPPDGAAAQTGAPAQAAMAVAVEDRMQWLAPVADPAARRAVVAWAEALVAGAELAVLPPDIAALAWPGPSDRPPDAAAPPSAARSAAAPSSPATWILSHAETDVLAVRRACAKLPEGAPPVRAASLLGLGEERDLGQLIGPRRGPGLVVVVRVHGRIDAVPGLTRLAREAREEGWALIALSGVDEADPALAEACTVAPEVAATTAAYFMAGGLENVRRALTFLAQRCQGAPGHAAPPVPMPAHGLYHPDLLLLSPDAWRAHRDPDRPQALVVFYRAHVLCGNLDFVDAIVRQLESRGFDAVAAYTVSLRDRGPDGLPTALGLLADPPDVVVNTVSFASMGSGSLEPGDDADPTAALSRLGAPWLQAIAVGGPRAAWQALPRGLNPTETTINVALPECDGRTITVPISFKEDHRYHPDAERVARVAGLARRLVALRRKPAGDKRLAIVLTNSGGRAKGAGSAVGLDTGASLLRLLRALRAAGWRVDDHPDDPDELMAAILARGAYDEQVPVDPVAAGRLSRARYLAWFAAQAPSLQAAMRQAWGTPTARGPTLAPVRWASSDPLKRGALLPGRSEPWTTDDAYLFAGLDLGGVWVGLQPPRGFGMDPDAIYHASDLPPSHHYAAFHRWLDEGLGADAIVHFGTHGTLEWLPGKALALSHACAPDALLGDLPLFYPFVVNNPGEGAQAKRRAHAVIIDHLVPPLAQAGTYGPLAALSRLVEEYYRAESLDPSKLPLLQSQIWQLVREASLEDDLRQIRRQRHGDHVHEWDERPNEQGVPRSLEKLSGKGVAHLLEDLDAWLCDLGRAQVRHGLHVLGEAPTGDALVDMLFAIGRCPVAALPALPDAVARACGLDPAALHDARGRWPGPLHPALGLDAAPSSSAVRHAVDALARRLLHQALASSPDDAVRALLGAGSADLLSVLTFLCGRVAADLARTPDELTHLLQALEGRFVPAGPSGAPSRGMAHVLPTGRNFYTVDPRGLPAPVSWTVGQALARDVLDRYLADEGALPEHIALSVWGTATMRTGGDEIAQALALLGVRPTWSAETRRTTGLEVIPLDELGRPRIDITLRVSGLFRDAFPGLVAMVDRAVRLVAELDEAPADNFVRKHVLAEAQQLVGEGLAVEDAALRAGYRVFSARPGAYGTGLLQLIEAGAWRDDADLARAFLSWGGWAYGAGAADGVEASDTFERRLASVDLALHNQDNREHDIFDSGDHFQFHGGLVATIAALSGRRPRAYFGDSSTPGRPETRTLQGEALRVYRSRVVNPKWLTAIQRHGYKGGLEMAATVDNLFGYAATAGVVTDWMFEGVVDQFTRGQARDFLQRANPWALHAMAERLLEASQRALWDASPDAVAHLQQTLLEGEAELEGAQEARPTGTAPSVGRPTRPPPGGEA